ncbi:MAG TPA: glycosyltransferase family 87 protein [Acidimicrobiia bacterium]
MTSTWSVRRVLLVVGAVLFLAAVFEFADSARLHYTNNWPVDYNLNIVAARRLVDREPLYDQAAARAEGIELLGKDMAKTGRSVFSSYIGDPAVALTHVPFLPFGNEGGARLFRIVSFFEMIGAIVLVAWSLSPPARAQAALLALAALFFGYPFVKGLALGQGTGLVMLALAVGVFGAARDRWRLAGIGLGVATALKVSPGLLVLYLLLRGKTRAVKSAIVSALALTLAAAAVGRPDDILVWLRDVSPSVSKGTVGAFNQSIVGALARLTTSVPDFWSHRAPGAWYLLAYVIWAVALCGLWRLRRGREFDPLELGVLILVILVAGPLSWDHYYAWALLPLVLVLDLERWRGRSVVECMVLIGVLVLATWWTRHVIPVPELSAVRGDWWERVRTLDDVGAGLAYLGVAGWMLARPGRSSGSTSECADGGTAAVGATREVVAGGVHRRG